MLKPGLCSFDTIRCSNGDFYVALGSSMGFGTFGLGRWWSDKAGFMLFW